MAWTSRSRMIVDEIGWLPVKNRMNQLLFAGLADTVTCTVLLV